MVAGTQEESGLLSTALFCCCYVLTCLCPAFNWFHAYDDTPAPASTERRGSRSARRAWPPRYFLSCVCSMFICFHVYDGKPPRLLQDDLVVPGAQTVPVGWALNTNN